MGIWGALLGKLRLARGRCPACAGKQPTCTICYGQANQRLCTNWRVRWAARNRKKA